MHNPRTTEILEEVKEEVDGKKLSWFDAILTGPWSSVRGHGISAAFIVHTTFYWAHMGPDTVTHPKPGRMKVVDVRTKTKYSGKASPGAGGGSAGVDGAAGEEKWLG